MHISPHLRRWKIEVKRDPPAKLCSEWAIKAGVAPARGPIASRVEKANGGGKGFPPNGELKVSEGRSKQVCTPLVASDALKWSAKRRALKLALFVSRDSLQGLLFRRIRSVK